MTHTLCAQAHANTHRTATETANGKRHANTTKTHTHKHGKSNNQSAAMHCCMGGKVKEVLGPTRQRGRSGVEMACVQPRRPGAACRRQQRPSGRMFLVFHR